MRTSEFRTLTSECCRVAVRVACVLAALCLPIGKAAAIEVPFLSGRVVDHASMLSSAAAADIEQRLKAYEDSTGNQIAVLIIPSLEGGNIEDFSMHVAETWKLGKKGTDNGAILLIARDERTLRIEVGYGLEASLTDAVTSYIIREIITPRFKAGDYEGGVRAGVDALIAAADGTLDTSSSPSSGFGSWGAALAFFLVWYGIIGLFTVVLIFSDGCATWLLYGFLSLFYAGGALAVADAGLPALGWGFFLLYLIGAPLLKVLAGKTAWGKKIARSMSSTSKGGRRGGSLGSAAGGWFSSGSSSGFSGGGFSGGGGSFGGGGSSGGW
jgi:uncharacterized protein